MLQGSGRDVVYRRRAIAQAARLTGGGFWSKSGACWLEVEGSKLGEGLGHGAELGVRPLLGVSGFLDSED